MLVIYILNFFGMYVCMYVYMYVGWRIINISYAYVCMHMYLCMYVCILESGSMVNK